MLEIAFPDLLSSLTIIPTQDPERCRTSDSSLLVIIPSVLVCTALPITLSPLSPTLLPYFFCRFVFVPACAAFAILEPFLPSFNLPVWFSLCCPI